MKQSEGRLRWLLEFVGNYEPKDFQEGSDLEKWELLKAGAEIKKFIAAEGSPCFVKRKVEWKTAVTIEGKEYDYPAYVPPLAEPLADVEIQARDTQKLCKAAADAVAQFTEKGPLLKVRVPAKGSRVITSESPTEIRHLFKGTRFISTPVQLAYDADLPQTTVAIGTLEELFIYRLISVLNETGTDKIAQCLECSSLFYKVRTKQKYCSKTCINRVTRREWLKNPKNRQKESESAHERYKKRVQKKHRGEKTKVRRRPRKTKSERHS